MDGGGHEPRSPAVSFRDLQEEVKTAGDNGLLHRPSADLLTTDKASSRDRIEITLL
jgi:hypothetical protein